MPIQYEALKRELAKAEVETEGQHINLETLGRRERMEKVNQIKNRTRSAKFVALL